MTPIHPYGNVLALNFSNCGYLDFRSRRLLIRVNSISYISCHLFNYHGLCPVAKKVLNDAIHTAGRVYRHFEWYIHHFLPSIF